MLREDKEMAGYEEYYEEVQDVLEDVSSALSDEEKSIVLFRIALEKVSNTLGVHQAAYIMSQLLTTTLGIIAEDDTADYDNILDKFIDQTKH
tara:strand:+ start:5395 stop:5670 length:276 start_codon:yes stop_codon:yes gene_type:complete